METKADRNQIVITTNTEDGKQKLPLNLLLTLAMGAVAGVVGIFGIIWGLDMLTRI